ncbi:hypothetical protein B9479_008326 [Cryptococcus floricola]|uniref:Uncharacterized protein n=1 Tax=Cryptococcus floricola TaxID=2591691 RepID=A0A5D3AL53_9TREE|nr:hypothetical protein B9479_008326 [Cryptococcus floricola]
MVVMEEGHKEAFEESRQKYEKDNRNWDKDTPKLRSQIITLEKQLRRANRIQVHVIWEGGSAQRRALWIMDYSYEKDNRNSNQETQKLRSQIITLEKELRRANRI